MKDNAALIPLDASSIVENLDDLDHAEKATVERETRALGAAMMNMGMSKLAIGEHLAKIRSVLEPHGVFVRFLAHFNFSVKTAYRYISAFENSQQQLPEPVLRAAMARGINMLWTSEDAPLGTYTDAVKELPPPRTTNPEKISAYLDELQEKRRELRSEGVPELPPQAILKQCFRFIDSRFQKLPKNHKTRQQFAERLVGMILTDLGISSPQTFAPQAIPEKGWKVVRGRPPKHPIAS